MVLILPMDSRSNISLLVIGQLQLELEPEFIPFYGLLRWPFLQQHSTLGTALFNIWKMKSVRNLVITFCSLVVGKIWDNFWKVIRPWLIDCNHLKNRQNNSWPLWQKWPLCIWFDLAHTYIYIYIYIYILSKRLQK